MKKQYDMHCNIAQTLNLIGDRWTLLILHAVREGRRTYKDLQEGLEGIPTNLSLIHIYRGHPVCHPDSCMPRFSV